MAHRTVIYNHRTYIPHSTTFGNRNNFRRTRNNFHRTSSNFRHNTNNFNHARAARKMGLRAGLVAIRQLSAVLTMAASRKAFPPVGPPASVGDFTAVVFMEAGAADNPPPSKLNYLFEGSDSDAQSKHKIRKRSTVCFFWLPLMTTLALFLALLVWVRQSSAQEATQPTYATAEQASQALYQAVQNGNEQAILQILGGRPELASSGDDLKDKAERKQFATKYQELHRLVRQSDGTTVLYIGAENWPFPVPLTSENGKWRFDAGARIEEFSFVRSVKTRPSPSRFAMRWPAQLQATPATAMPPPTFMRKL